MASLSSTFILSKERKTTLVNNAIIAQGVGGGRAARSHTNHS
jgi:hypothetical protein